MMTILDNGIYQLDQNERAASAVQVQDVYPKSVGPYCIQYGIWKFFSNSNSKYGFQKMGSTTGCTL